jgi:hypothetical protein
MTWYHDEIRPSMEHEIAFRNAFYRVKFAQNGEPVKRQVYIEALSGMARVWDSRLVDGEYAERLEHGPGCIKFPFNDAPNAQTMNSPFRSRDMESGMETAKRVVISGMSEGDVEGFGKCACFDWELRKGGDGGVLAEKNRYYYSPSAGLVRVVRLFPRHADVTMRLG